jgi:class 3 adenylate cyclase
MGAVERAWRGGAESRQVARDRQATHLPSPRALVTIVIDVTESTKVNVVMLDLTMVLSTNEM